MLDWEIYRENDSELENGCICTWMQWSIERESEMVRKRERERESEPYVYMYKVDICIYIYILLGDESESYMKEVGVDRKRV